ncbi:hypothetical protein [Anaerocolumna sp. AGMB13020]|uniref:hypothetical protein n=1 Tax=Anaerocolumna sp. AGMB13020 TaxID=3081750 RepID=UPI003FA47E05
MDTSVKQSGEFNSIHIHMSKRGSPYLPHAMDIPITGPNGKTVNVRTGWIIKTDSNGPQS